MELTEGVIFRRIPNWPTHFDEKASRPEIDAFVPRPRDEGCLSAHTDEAEAREELAKPQHTGFGLCRLDIGAVRRATNGAVTVWATGPRSHVEIRNCGSPPVQLVLAKLAVVVISPAIRRR